MFTKIVLVLVFLFPNGDSFSYEEIIGEFATQAACEAKVADLLAGAWLPQGWANKMSYVAVCVKPKAVTGKTS